MARKTAIIDLGSNSARMLVIKRTSRLGFHFIKEVKSRVRVGEGAYEKQGFLQEIPRQRTINALRSFQNIAKSLKCTKILCVATSALRDAPNGKEFIKEVKDKLNLNFKIIDGKKEAFYGGVAAMNLLSNYQEATTIDIGGGSTELAKIKDNKITHTISLNVGTVRLKELFFDSNKQNLLDIFLDDLIKQIPDDFKSNVIIAIGGTLRAVANAIMEKEEYPIKTVHGYSFSLKKYSNFIEKIPKTSVLDLKKYNFKKDRLDTIREGCAIFDKIYKKLEAKKFVTSGAGVREGVFLSDILRPGYKFPQNFNPSVKSLSDRFLQNHENTKTTQYAMLIFDALMPLHKIPQHLKKSLSVCAKLHNIGSVLSIYQEHLHSFYFILNNLNFGFTHEEKMLIAILIKSNNKKLPQLSDLKEFEALLPDFIYIEWLSFILTLSKVLTQEPITQKLEFSYANNVLFIDNASELNLAKEQIKKLVKPAAFAITFNN